ncbi:hypothetical protein ACHAW6_007164 [Cyclotella cf. meneghiniana]
MTLGTMTQTKDNTLQNKASQSQCNTTRNNASNVRFWCIQSIRQFTTRNASHWTIQQSFGHHQWNPATSIQHCPATNPCFLQGCEAGSHHTRNATTSAYECGSLANNGYTTVILPGQQGVDVYHANDVNISSIAPPALQGKLLDFCAQHLVTQQKQHYLLQQSMAISSHSQA